MLFIVLYMYLQLRIVYNAALATLTYARDDFTYLYYMIVAHNFLL